MVSFTGSTGVGRRVMAASAGRGARVHLELGGKAPFVVFDDADLEAAVHGAVAASDQHRPPGQGRLDGGGDLADGFGFPPTLVTGVDQGDPIVAQEVFGPVLTVIGFRTDDEALRLANDSPYGLAASAWTRDLQRGLHCATELRAGTVWLNDHIPIWSEMPHGGFGHSGFGKDMSTYSLHEYTQVKHVALDRTGTARKDWHRTVFALDRG